IWRDSAATMLTPFLDSGSGARSINTKGQIVGWSYDPDMSVGIMWFDGLIESFRQFTSAIGISSAGDIVFQVGNYSTLKRGTTFTDLDFDAEGITASGVVYGGLDYGRPLIFRNGQRTDLGTIPKNGTGSVLGANNRGQAIGIVNRVGAIWT